MTRSSYIAGVKPWKGTVRDELGPEIDRMKGTRCKINVKSARLLNRADFLVKYILAVKIFVSCSNTFFNGMLFCIQNNPGLIGSSYGALIPVKLAISAFLAFYTNLRISFFTCFY